MIRTWSILGGYADARAFESGLYERVLSLPLSFFDKRPAGVLPTRLTNDVDALGEVIGAGIVTIVLDILMVFGCYWGDALFGC